MLLNSKVCTFNSNKSKAIKILLSNDSDIETILKGNKLISFYRGIIGDTEAVWPTDTFNIPLNRVTSLSKFPQFQISITRLSQTSTETLKTLSIRNIT